MALYIEEGPDLPQGWAFGHNSDGIAWVLTADDESFALIPNVSDDLIDLAVAAKWIVVREEEPTPPTPDPKFAWVLPREGVHVPLPTPPTHKPIGKDGPRWLDCEVCGQPWPCGAAREPSPPTPEALHPATVLADALSAVPVPEEKMPTTMGGPKTKDDPT